MSVKHIAAILDGNRRWAKSRGLKPWKGHEEGAKKVDEFLNWCRELGIKETTLYCLSTENLKRDKLELNFMFKLFKTWFSKIKKDKKLKEEQIKIRFIGNLELVPEEIKKLALELEEETKTYKNYIVNFCFSYGGRQEILHAINKLKNKEGEITEHDITNNLLLQSEPEIIIRTGNKVRTSNFLPWQSIYSEWFFLDKMWPDIRKEDLIKILKDFEEIQRNFGK